MSRFIQLLCNFARQCGRALVVMMLIVSAALMTIFLESGSNDPSDKLVAGDGWGSEALSRIYDGVYTTVIPLANACGLGASSCFKCHNGKRAKAANMDSEKAPWHSDHSKVNKSCAGCHKGNPRLMKEEMAHKKMLGDPLTDTGEACANCHEGGDLDALSKSYMSLRGNK